MLFNLPPSLVAALTGFLSGFLLSVPVGPVNLTIMNEGARRGLGWALMIGFGAVVMEVIYCALAFTGFASLFTGDGMKRAMELGSFVFMLYLGIRFLMVRTVAMPGGVEEQIKAKFNPHAAFAIGFVRVMANPGVFAFLDCAGGQFHLAGMGAGDLAGQVLLRGGRGGRNLGLVQRLELCRFARTRQIHRKDLVAHGTFFRILFAGPGLDPRHLYNMAHGGA